MLKRALSVANHVYINHPPAKKGNLSFQWSVSSNAIASLLPSHRKYLTDQMSQITVSPLHTVVPFHRLRSYAVMSEPARGTTTSNSEQVLCTLGTK